VEGLVALYLHPRIPHENNFLHPQLKASGNDRRCYCPPWSSGTNTARRLAAFAAVCLLLARNGHHVWPTIEADECRFRSAPERKMLS
jgi:hypothetical protein